MSVAAVVAFLVLNAAGAGLRIRGPPVAGGEQWRQMMKKASQREFVIQMVGPQQRNGYPMSPMDERANLCWNVGGQDKLNSGFTVEFKPCNHQSVEAIKAPVSPNALWHFTQDGMIRSVGTGMCLRKMKCKEYNTEVVDVGPCMAHTSINFIVQKAVGGNPERMQDLGSPLAGVIDPGNVFGPFKLKISNRPSDLKCDGSGTCEKIKQQKRWEPYLEGGMTRQPATVPVVNGKPFVSGSLVTDLNPDSLVIVDTRILHLIRSPLEGVMCGTSLEVTAGGSDLFFYFIQQSAVANATASH